MRERPLITFALLAYNQERFIEEAIRGALSQTYSPLEIILSDDFSRDETFEIMQRMAKEYLGPHRIILNRNQSNLGLVPHVNRVAMELSAGELLVLAAGDDISLPERTETVWQAWEETGRQAYGISAGFTKIDTNGVLADKINWQRSGFIEGDLNDFVANLKGGVGCSFAFHRDVFSSFGPITIPKSIEDRTIAIRARMLGKVYWIEKPLVLYRVTGNNITRCDSYRERVRKYADWHTQIYQQVVVDAMRCIPRLTLSDRERTEITRIAEGKIRMLARRRRLVSDRFAERFAAWVTLLFDPYVWLKQHVLEFKLVLNMKE
jgi:glycosyltransferase involved in cell wall biosynthesis